MIKLNKNYKGFNYNGCPSGVREEASYRALVILKKEQQYAMFVNRSCQKDTVNYRTSP